MKTAIDYNNIPQHIAIIMDGNGRWAKQKGAERVFGHRNAITAVREATEGAAEIGVKYLTLYAFSTENWGRPRAEVRALMQLLVSTIRKEVKGLMENNVRLSFIGDDSLLPKVCQKELKEAIEITSRNDGLTLTLALNYSGRWDILQAVNQLLQNKEGQPFEEITAETFERFLSTQKQLIPDPELLIRTSGEMRISNFMLWQLAYSEIYISSILWPDFRRAHLFEAVIEYQKRERRFGKTSEQLKTH
ncbi:MAG: isoprenyl transferase [Cytophagales bacterium]|nr:MAG: isoprenyl transferase [Cytophagales bacterium]